MNNIRAPLVLSEAIQRTEIQSTCQNRPPFVSFRGKATNEWKSPGANDPQRTSAPSVRGKMPEELVFIF